MNKEQVVPDSTWYSTDAFTDYAIQFAREAQTDNKPFFMYLAYIAPHFPLQARPEDIDKYRGKYSKGHEFYRRHRFEKQKRLGILPAHTKLSPPDYKDWESVKDKTQEDLKMAVYAAQMDRMDQNIGRLITALKKQDGLDNTIVFFLSDNGGADTNLHAHPEAEIGSRHCWSAYGRSWANVSNTPYRKYKAMTHEGGIITPLIVHWPDGIKTRGRISHEPVHIVDIVPTVLSLARSDYPKTYKGQALAPLMGTDIMPLVHGKTRVSDKTMFFEHQGNQAARMGNWKLVRRHNQEWELYNLAEDPTELDNLINEQVQIADSLRKLFNQWAEQCGVRPWPIEKRK